MEVDFGVIEGHDGVAGVGALVADEDEMLELRKEAFEVDAVHIAAVNSFSPEVGDIAAQDANGLKTPVGHQCVGLDDVRWILDNRLALHRIYHLDLLVCLQMTVGHIDAQQAADAASVGVNLDGLVVIRRQIIQHIEQFRRGQDIDQ